MASGIRISSDFQPRYDAVCTPRTDGNDLRVRTRKHAAIQEGYGLESGRTVIGVTTNNTWATSFKDGSGRSGA